MSSLIIRLILLATALRKKVNFFFFDSANLCYLRIQSVEFFFCLLVSYYPKINITVRQKLGYFTFLWFCPWGLKKI